MPSDEQAIRDLFHAWQRATLANDREAMRRLMADDVLFLTVGRPPLRGPDAFVDLMPDQPPDHIDFDQLHARQRAARGLRAESGPPAPQMWRRD